MNFNELYNKAKSGNATNEELILLKEEIDSIIDTNLVFDSPLIDNCINEAEFDTVKKARKKFNRNNLIRILIVTIITLLLIAAIVCGIIFIPACTSASKKDYLSRDVCVEKALQYIEEYTGLDSSKMIIKDIDKEISIGKGLRNAVYIYEIELISPEGVEYELAISTKSGYVIIKDIDLVD